MQIHKITSTFFLFLVSVFFIGCKPELPVTSSITVDMETVSVPVNKDLYGLTIEEINHAIDGGLYAELIRNRSFEEGVLPPHCTYNSYQKTLQTPNGWSLPFPNPDMIPGWRVLNTNSYISTDNKNTINDKNQRSLVVSIHTSATIGRGGVAAEGYKGISVKKGEKYNLSFYLRTSSTIIPRTIQVALEDSAATTIISDVYQVKPFYEWRKYQHTFTAKEDLEDAVLTFACDSSTFFWLDMVSLFPEKTWQNRKNGLRSDLVAMLDSLNPSFVRFPGGSFAEGYTVGTYPVWNETLGDIAERKHFWNIWSYGSTNGVGYHEFLQLCEDLKAEPIYVLNSGVTSQTRRARYLDLFVMSDYAEETLAAIAYANDPPNTPYGSLRVKNGHPEPFNLKYVEIGSENFSYEYERRFAFFEKKVKELYPDVTIISSSVQSKHPSGIWADHHFYANTNFFIANHDRFNSNVYPRQYPNLFIGEFSVVEKTTEGTLRAAVAEACFLIAAERSPDKVKRLAYAPVLGNVKYKNERQPLISFTNSQAVGSPSYYLLRMFTAHRGNEIVKTVVDTYSKPQVSSGKVRIVADDSYQIRNEHLKDISGYHSEYTVEVKRIKGGGEIRFQIRDNEEKRERQNYIAVTLGGETSELYQQVGTVWESMSITQSLQLRNDEWYNIRITCNKDTIRCFVNTDLLHEAMLPPLPSLVTLATYDKENKALLLKVVNTSYHEEKTELHIQGVSVKGQAHLIQLSGEPDSKNTIANPLNVIPIEKEISFPIGTKVYRFPPNSITIMKFPVN